MPIRVMGYRGYDLYVFAMLACHLPSHHIKEVAFSRLHSVGRPPSGAAPLCGFHYVCRGGSKNMHKYKQTCITYVYLCIYFIYSCIIPYISPLSPLSPYQLIYRFDLFFHLRYIYIYMAVSILCSLPELPPRKLFRKQLYH